MLTSTFPPGLIDAALESTDRMEQRHRLLPARVVVYFVLAMWRKSWRVPTTGALTQVRPG
ncbi:MAG: hypothetical protein EPN48_01595 [Microbacteriaceae bacterium]|nr:MAG: hypothetical protein EPN48_01595 [Microbacteriaceae bacterium]